MTKAYFSPSLKSFIPITWKNDGTYSDEDWPADAFIATDQEITMYWKQTPPPGKLMGVAGGRPAWVDEPAPTREQIIEQANSQQASLIQKASSKISILQDAVDLGMATTEETDTLTALKKYRVILMRIDTSKAPDIEWPVLPGAQVS